MNDRNKALLFGEDENEVITITLTDEDGNDIDAEIIYSSEIVANDIACSTISCSGNIVVRLESGESLVYFLNTNHSYALHTAVTKLFFNYSTPLSNYYTGSALPSE